MPHPLGDIVGARRVLAGVHPACAPRDKYQAGPAGIAYAAVFLASDGPS